MKINFQEASWPLNEAWESTPHDDMRHAGRRGITGFDFVPWILIQVPRRCHMLPCEWPSMRLSHVVHLHLLRSIVAIKFVTIVDRVH